ncbi:NlpC/P60 family protein [Saccharopolyspora taberi]|uniref:NlpC/P60 family protein n=1 Tax=Saccharopolyspora taberi TaxID=60895 RepID=UPI0031D762F7
MAFARGFGRRGASALAAVAAVALAVPGAGLAAPEPPDPGTADRVGALTSRLAAAEARLVDLSAQVELKMEDANKARVDLQRAEREVRAAEQTAASAGAEVDAAGRQIEEQRRRLDDFAARSYRQGSRLGSLTALAGVRGPDELLARAELLDVVGRTELDVLDDLERARVEKVNKDSLARAAEQRAQADRAAADDARSAAEAAENAAIAAQADQLAQIRPLEADKSEVEAQLAAVRAQFPAAEEPPRPPEPAPDDAVPAGDAVETVIQRAMSQLGVTYAWGGGTSSGPSRGIRDGGVADSHGDFRKVGFDCSGLMLYAFAGAGIELDHYSGYQYLAGHQVPVSAMRRGDMLFWQDSGRTHHVALYLGGGRMIEAPYSGAQVRIAPVRYSGLAPYAVRLL